MEHPLTTTGGEVAGVIIGFWCLALGLVVLPVLQVWLLFQSLADINSRDFREKWRGLFTGIKTRSHINMYYYMLYTIRRLIFVSIAFNWVHFEAPQILLLMACNLFICVYHLETYAFNSKWSNHVEMFNELTIMVVTIHLLFFTQWIPDQEMQYLLGWSMIYFIIQNIIINLLIVSLITLWELYLAFQKLKPTIIMLLKRFCMISIYNGHHLERWHICPCLREPENYPDYYEVDLEIPEQESFLEKVMACFSKRKPKPAPRPEPV